MAYGLRVWDAAGNLTLDTSTRLGRVLGFVEVSANGSLTVPEFDQGQGFARVNTTGNDIGPNAQYGWPPSVSISGTTLSWSYPSTTRGPAIIVYGVY